MRVSAETIYQSLYVQSRGALRRDLTTCLRTGRALRRPGRQAGKRRNQIPDMINITERPAEADDRAVPGHWEGDLIIGKNNRTAIGTLVQRTTGYTMLVHLPDADKPEQVRDALTEKIKTIPEILRGSLTWDQGIEMRDRQQVSVAADIDVYFCDPHAGNAPRARTPTDCCASTSPRTPTCPPTALQTSSESPPNSTTDRANA
jgi:transposase, IS30 family